MLYERKSLSVAMPQCQLRPPFMGLSEKPEPPKMTYDLRSHSCYEVNVTYPLLMKKEWLKDSVCEVNSRIIYMIQTFPYQILPNFLRLLMGQRPEFTIVLGEELLTNEDLLSVQWINGTSVMDIMNLSVTDQTDTVTEIEGVLSSILFDLALSPPNVGTSVTALGTKAQILLKYATRVADQISVGHLPLIIRDYSNRVTIEYVDIYNINWSPPITIGDRGYKPRLTMVEHYRTCVYSGQYGMGDVVKTFSLLPGEKSTITIKTYKNSVTTRTKAENIIDSYSESSADEFERSLESENSSKQTKGSEFNASTKLERTIGGDLTSVGVPLNVSATNTTEAGYKMTNSRENAQRTLSKTTDKHVNNSARNRKIEINTTSTETVTEGFEELIVRQLENINKSRVLNFVYRQMNQEYLTIRYLADVTFLFSVGTIESERHLKLNELPAFFEEIFEDQAAKDNFLHGILMELCNIMNYQGKPESLINCAEVVLKSCCESIKVDPITLHYPQVAPPKSTYQGITVEGIITNVSSYVLPTDDVVCDAMLGGGEALDCYNIRLQEAAVVSADLQNEKARLENIKTEQMLKIIELIDDPAQKALLYKKVFGTCCDVAQTGGCGCGCNDSSDTTGGRLSETSKTL